MASMTLSAKVAAFAQEYATLLSLYSEMLEAEAANTPPRFGWGAMALAADQTFGKMEEHYRAVPATQTNNGILAEGMAVSAIIKDVAERAALKAKQHPFQKQTNNTTCALCGQIWLDH